MMTLRRQPRGLGGHCREPDQFERDGWRDQGVLAVAAKDERLTSAERHSAAGRNSMASAARQGRRSDEHSDTAPDRGSAGGSSIRTQAFAGAARMALALAPERTEIWQLARVQTT